MPPLLNTQHYKVGSRVKGNNPWKGVAPSPTPRCSSYRKGSLWVTRRLRSPTLLFIIEHYIIKTIIIITKLFKPKKSEYVSVQNLCNFIFGYSFNTVEFGNK